VGGWLEVSAAPGGATLLLTVPVAADPEAQDNA
jgi:hypothetical protein